MTEQEISATVRLSCQRALLGAITPNIRMITIGWDSLSKLRLRAYYDSPPTKEDKEAMEIVTTEIIADIPFETCDQAECICSNAPFKDLEILKHIAYARKE